MLDISPKLASLSFCFFPLLFFLFTVSNGTGGIGGSTTWATWERENLCLMSSDVLRHIRDKLYETLNTNLREKLVGCKTVYFGLVHLCRGDPCQDLGGKLNLEIWCPSGLKICILFSSKVKIYIKMRIKTFLGPV